MSAVIKSGGIYNKTATNAEHQRITWYFKYLQIDPANTDHGAIFDQVNRIS